ncbi:nicotinate-nucleotide adenylyltransferase [Propionispira arboris]|uniref:Probable nicotinate-nucleotide adenylyltransferase n=1 Tax=Propionispira arboris TaxID=84035 RepID=A0A1H7AR68_9FIRM|nr:nicotinate-nucleotide adenylyltransferase [Propionispira arboris]SEJ67436.1 nicotinate-nucleotide adenylyltransferase [Propionispira arboris]
MQAIRRIGIMGGTFDPIHMGHLVTADAARMEYGLDQVVLIPDTCPPHKQQMAVTSVQHRYRMALLATDSNLYFNVLPLVEINGPSYTIDTVKSLKKNYGENTELYLIIGSDLIRSLPHWYGIDELLCLCKVIVAPRQGSIGAIKAVIHHFGETGKRRIFRLKTPELEISSTEIREKVRAGKSICYIVPENVEHYINKEKLYRSY